MIRSLRAVLVVGMFLLVGMTAVVSAQETAQPTQVPGFVPHWKVGDHWTLEASYRDMRAPGEVWLPPIRWVFKVKAIKNLHRQDCYVIHVYPRTRRIKMQAVLYLSTRDLRPVRVIDIYPTAEGVKSKERDIDPFSPQPLINESTLVPYDLPVFPLVKTTVQRADGFAAYAPPEPKKFGKVTRLGGLSFLRTVKQTEKKPDAQHADVFRNYRFGGDSFQVELQDTKGQTPQTQIWQDGAPWALSTDMTSRKVRLLTQSQANPAPKAPNQTSTEGDQR